VVDGVIGYEQAPSLMRVSTDAIASEPSQMVGVPGYGTRRAMPQPSRFRLALAGTGRPGFGVPIGSEFLSLGGTRPAVMPWVGRSALAVAPGGGDHRSVVVEQVEVHHATATTNPTAGP
jgi:hypothetical protein